jgi:putative transferase (TIGR04331 family)
MRELVLTGHKDTWPVDEREALFLGQHCFCYSDRFDFPDQDKLKVAPVPWNDNRDILDAALYIDRLHDRIIPRLSDIMNGLCGLSYSDRFWDVYMVLWLDQWLSILYDRYRRLEYIGENILEKLTVKILDECNLEVSDLWGSITKFRDGHYHNLLLMSDIINHAKFDFLDCRKISVQEPAGAGDDEAGVRPGAGERFMALRENIKECLNYFFTGSVFLGTTYGLSLKDKIFLQLYRDPVLLFKKKPKIPTVKARSVTRSAINSVRLEFGAKNGFEEVVQKMLLKYIPDTFLMVDKYCAGTSQDVKTWVGCDIYLSQKKCFEVASCLERGGRWISSQHGGSYGQLLSFPTGKCEYAAGGEFITWGWKHRHIYDAAFYPLPSPMLSRLKKHKEAKDSIIFVNNTVPAYRHRLHTFFGPESIVGYIRDKKIFLECLDKRILARLKYRPRLYGYDIPLETRFIKKMLTADQVLAGENVRLTDHFSVARIVVVNYPDTSFMEAMAMNAPTIAYWSPAYVAHCATAETYINALRSAGIVYDSPQAAAEKINKIWDDVDGWWSDPETQRAKDDFCFQFARSQPDWRKEWASFVKNL